MNYCTIQRNGVTSYLDREDTVVCPKPRRTSATLRWHLGGHEAESRDARAGSEVLDIILTEGGCGGDGVERLSSESSPPFFSGSPPSRVSNPLVHDARFMDDQILGPRGSPSSGSRKGGCSRAIFGTNPAVRVEGFDCRDRNRSIPALA